MAEDKDESYNIRLGDEEEEKKTHTHIEREKNETIIIISGHLLTSMRSFSSFIFYFETETEGSWEYK